MVTRGPLQLDAQLYCVLNYARSLEVNLFASHLKKQLQCLEQTRGSDHHTLLQDLVTTSRFHQSTLHDVLSNQGESKDNTNGANDNLLEYAVLVSCSTRTFGGPLFDFSQLSWIW